MKKRQLLYALPLLAGAIFISDLAISKLTNFTMVNRAGDVAGPGVTARKDCTGCHADFSAVNNDTINRIFTMDSGIKEYTPGTTHTIKFKLLSTGTVGFSATVLKNDSNKMVGVLAPADTAETKLFLHAASGRYYLNHRVGTTTDGVKEYTFNWTAPAKGTGPVTFYFSSVTSNNDNDQGLDTVFNNTFVITEKTITIGLNNAAANASMKVFPNPASDRISVSFNNAASGMANISLVSLDGKQTYELKNEQLSSGAQTINMELPTLTSGIYFMKISINNTNLVQKVLIY